MTALWLFLVLAAALASAVAAHYAATRKDGPVSKARSFSEQMRGAAMAFAIASLPGFFSVPDSELMASAYTALEVLGPISGGLGIVLVIFGVSTLMPAINAYIRERELRAQETARACSGINYPETPTSVVQSINTIARQYDVDVDVETAQGLINILIETKEGKYAVYLLPKEHLRRGGRQALARASAAAELLDALPILWSAPNGPPRGYRASGHKAYILEGRAEHLLHLIRRLDRSSQAERKRVEERKRHRAAARSHEPIRSSIDPETARSRHDLEGWERFAHQAPRHPTIQDVLYRRTEGRCAECKKHVPDERTMKVVVTDYDHACRLPDSIRLVPRDSVDDVPVNMPDCAQCHYEQPEYFESCINRMTIAHEVCPSETEEARKEAEYASMERRAQLAREHEEARKAAQKI